MLTELSDLQESSEEVWGTAEVSFTIRTRSEERGELIEREYTFSNAPEWETWTFTEFEEKRTDDTALVSARNWRRSRHVLWQESDAATVEVPPEVESELQELLGLESLNIQHP
jgi:hypothetical protein